MIINKIKLVLYTTMAIGLLFIFIGLWLILFTDTYIKHGVEDVLLIAGLIGAGLFLFLPVEIILTLQLMKKNDEKLKAARESNPIH